MTTIQTFRESPVTPIPDTIDAPGWGFTPGNDVAPLLGRVLRSAWKRFLPWLVPVLLIAVWQASSSFGWLSTRIPGIVAGFTITLVSLTGYSAMAGAIGGGGLGDLGIRYGYQRFLPEVMVAVVLLLKPWVAKLVKAYQSAEIKQYVQTEFKGAVVVGF